MRTFWRATATHDHVLLEAGLLHANGLITCLSADADNRYLCLSARALAAQLTIVAPAYEEESIDKLYRAGADQVVSPNVSAPRRPPPGSKPATTSSCSAAKSRSRA